MNKLIVLENDADISGKYLAFIDNINTKWTVYCPTVSSNWDCDKTKLGLAMLLSRPEVTDVVMKTAFQSIALLRQEVNPKQIEVLLPVIREALIFREEENMLPLQFHIVYCGEDFLDDLKDGSIGKSTQGELELIFRQQSNIIVKIYDPETLKLKLTLPWSEIR